MRRDEVLRILDAHRDDLTKRGVAELSLFGSVARDRARPDSDVDLLVKLNRPMGLFEFQRVKDYLEAILGTSVDLVKESNLKPRVRAHIFGGSTVEPKRWLQRLDDMLLAIQRIREYTADVTKQQWEENRLLADAVMMNFIVIGEAAGAIPADIQARYPAIPWTKMKALRNAIAHDYISIDFDVLWSIVTRDIFTAEQALQAMLSAEEEA